MSLRDIVNVNVSSPWSTSGSRRLDFRGGLYDEKVDSLNKLTQLVLAVKFQHSPIPASFHIVPMLGSSVRHSFQIQILWAAPDRENGIKTSFAAGWSFTAPSSDYAWRVGDWLALFYRVAEEVFRHELRESMHYGQHRLADDHNDLYYTPWQAAISECGIR